MTDEDVIQRRLIIDGDGTGDDRRLNQLLKSFITWASANVSQSESQIMQDKLFLQLDQCEYAFKKSRMVAKASSAQLENHESLAKEISADIEKTKSNIEIIKDEFEEAKIVHSNWIEYEVLANAIKQQPSRKLTDEELTQLKQELDSLEKKRNNLNSKLDFRRNHCHILMASIQQVQSLIEMNEKKVESSLLDDFDDEDLDILSRPAE